MVLLWALAIAPLWNQVEISHSLPGVSLPFNRNCEFSSLFLLSSQQKCVQEDVSSNGLKMAFRFRINIALTNEEVKKRDKIRNKMLHLFERNWPAKHCLAVLESNNDTVISFVYNKCEFSSKYGQLYLNNWTRRFIMVMTQYKMMCFVFCWYRLPVKYNLNRIAPISIFISFVYFYFSKSVQKKEI